jgi:hypothetical protein
VVALAVPGVAAAWAGVAAGSTAGRAPIAVVVVSPRPGTASTMVPAGATVVGATVVGATVVGATVEIGVVAPAGGSVVSVVDATG